MERVARIFNFFGRQLAFTLNQYPANNIAIGIDYLNARLKSVCGTLEYSAHIDLLYGANVLRDKRHGSRVFC